MLVRPPRVEVPVFDDGRLHMQKYVGVRDSICRER